MTVSPTHQREDRARTEGLAVTPRPVGAVRA